MSDNSEPGAQHGARPAGRLLRGLNFVAAGVLFAMAALTFIDVVGRDAFNAPIPGTFEIVGLMLSVVALGAFPFVTLSQRHITVDLFDGFIRGRFRRVRDAVVMLGIAAMAVFMAERLWAAAIDEWRNDFVTEYFSVSRAPLLILLGLFCAGAGIALLLRAVGRGGADAAPASNRDSDPDAC